MRRESAGRGFGRGPLLLVVVFLASGYLFSQSRVEIDQATADRLRRQIASGSVEEKRSALFEIRNIRSASASQLAVPALRDPDEMVRATAASSVVFLPKVVAAGALIPNLSDRTEFVRRETAYALGEVGDASATASLVRSMESDRSPEVKHAAAAALGKIGDVSAVESLARRLKLPPAEEDELLRRCVARSLGQIAQIVRTGERTVVTPRNFLPEKFKDHANGAEANGFSSAVPVLSSVLQNTAEADDTRREAAFALGAIGDARAIQVLERFASAPDPYLAEICREALLRIKREKA